ncbi:MAG: 30S ribosomal protein S4e [Candidatus Aenigmarchaeota archaeon]|nr:30S ribosomal protein S4e [Candidatus Aenigmarchaeota archaeon]
MPHLKRLLAPKFWGVKRKESKWVVTPRPGPHPKFSSIPLSIILTSILKIADTTSEAKKIIRKGELFVDGKRRKDYGYPVGLFDLVSIPSLKKSYRVIPTPKGLEIIEINEKESMKICKIKNKTVLEKGKVQLNLDNGKNILVADGNYKTGDSLLLELPSLKIIDHLPLTKGNTGLVVKGENVGKLAKVKDLIKGGMKQTPKVLCEIGKEEKIIERGSFIVVGKDKPVMKIA